VTRHNGQLTRIRKWRAGRRVVADRRPVHRNDEGESRPWIVRRSPAAGGSPGRKGARSTSPTPYRDRRLPARFRPRAPPSSLRSRTCSGWG
jgi:hypothetical protein